MSISSGVVLVNPDRRESMQKQLRRNACGIGALISLSVLILALTLVSMFAIKPLVEKRIIAQTLVDSEDAKGFNTWAGYDMPDIYYELYVFDIENPAAAANGSEKVRVKEVGPYTFKEYRIKHNITFSDDGNVVSYYQWQYYVFDESRSAPGLKENDTFMTVNVALQGIISNSQLDPLKIFNWKNDLVKGLVCEAWEKEEGGYGDRSGRYSPFVRVPITQYFWGMKDEPIMKRLGDWIQNLDDKLPFLKIVVPSSDFPGLGVLNYTSMEDTLARSNVIMQYTGKNDSSLTAKYIKWENMTEIYVCPLPPKRPEGVDNLVNCPHFQTEWDEEQAKKQGWVKMWGSDEANAIVGTDLVRWPRGNSDTDLLGFVDSIYRSAHIEALWDSERALPEFHNVPAVKFSLRDQDMLNASVNKANAAYFDFGPSGLLNMTMKAGLPLFVSKPHFLDGDERLISGVEGLHPDPSKHNTWIMKNNLLGQTIAAFQCVQLNVLVPDMDFGDGDKCNSFGLNPFPCCSEKQTGEWNGKWTLNSSSKVELGGVYVPIVHVVEKFTIREDQAKQIRLAETMYNKVPIYAQAIGFPLFTLCLVGVVILVVQRRKISQGVYDDSEIVDVAEREKLLQHEQEA